jgi:hypothetical protein
MKCSSGKTSYSSEIQAIDALLDVWSRNAFRENEGPVTIYCCDVCREFHFTSKGEMHEKLKELRQSGKLEKLREAARWEEKFRKF